MGTIDDSSIEGFGITIAYVNLNQAKDTIPAVITALTAKFSHRINELLGA